MKRIVVIFLLFTSGNAFCLGKANTDYISAESTPNYYTSLTFLYWQSREDGLKIALSNPSGAQFTPNIGGTFIDMHFKYKPGFKVGFGYRVNKEDNWELSLEYTRFHQTTGISSSAPSGGSLITLWLAGTNTGFASSTSAYWRLSFDQLDLELARPSNASSSVVLRPHMGLRAYWLDQRLHVKYFNVISSQTGGPFSVEASSRNKVDSWSLGPTFGLNSRWLLGLGFRFNGNASASLLYSHFRTNHKESNTSSTLPPTNISDNHSSVSPIIDMGLGMGWGMDLSKKRFHLDFEADYVFQVYWDQNRMNDLGNIPSFAFGGGGGNDLYFHGLMLKGRFDF